MSRYLESPKFFAVAAILFTIATIFNLSGDVAPVSGSNLFISPVSAPSMMNQIGPNDRRDAWSSLQVVRAHRDGEDGNGPTMPPDPFNPPKVAGVVRDGEDGNGPTMPPDPFNPPKVAGVVRDGEDGNGPTMPPDPFNPPKAA